AAVAAARGAGRAIRAVGDRAGHFRSGTVGEGSDAADLRLPGLQGELVDAVLATGTPTVIVLLCGRPLDLSRIAPRAAAILLAWFPGQDGGAALVDALFGDANPAGRTPVTWSRGAGAQPRFYNHKALARGIPPLPDFEPVFAFGHGLSYTRFEYDELAIEPSAPSTSGTVTVSCRVRNVGGRAGAEVVQLYLPDPLASVARPVQELRGFCRVGLAPGRAARVAFSVAADLTAFTGPELRRVVEPGRIEVMIGASSA